MYEDMTYETIIGRMLDRVPNGLDKREGSLIYTALSAAAAEMQVMYIEFDTILKETFAETASRENLIRRAAERGMEPSPATNAVFKAVADPESVTVELGQRFRLGIYYYTVTKIIGNGIYQLTCETAGTVGNRQVGRLVPVETISGLTSIELTDLLIPGEDEEDTEAFRKTYINSFMEKSFSGNRKDYLDKTNGIPGVGATKITRAWNGPSTVKLTILDSNYNKASDLLIQTVQDAMDPAMSGNGDGLAPIDHVVTVDTAEEIKIQMKCTLEYESSYEEEDLKAQIKEAAESYLKELRASWEGLGDHGCVVRISQIEARILALEGIYDIKNTQINGAAENLELNKNQIPVYGGIEIDSRS
ncbi:baseplate J/gp47 family protein [Lacrimispora sp. JR3]|uniref:baseplate J/gp47 family protein n=1 Tax=Lacrimispora sinapis TaxID=3111456 RepID=UPI00374A8FB6